jgi:hypothetical protein
MTISFTICSNNYLAHAKTLGDSYLKFHPDHKFIIGLVDTYCDTIDYGAFNHFEIIPVGKLNMPEFDMLNKKYNIIELNTSVKPAFFHHIFQEYQPAKVIYLDPDILVLSSFEELLQILQSKNIVITPHMCSPIDDEYTQSDHQLLSTGVFNLGFIALSDYTKVSDFLNWWQERLFKYGYANLSKNMFYDQLWINYVPALYENYYILKHPGYNMANWNLHERILSVYNEQYMVNTDFALRFFHFSGYKHNNPGVVSCYQNRYTFQDRPELVSLFNYYQEQLKQNNVDIISKAHVFYYPELYKKKRTVWYKYYTSKVKNALKRRLLFLGSN